MVDKLTGEKSSTQKGLANALEEFKDFTDGVRVLFLLYRAKDGGDSSDEDKRTFTSRVSMNSKEFAQALEELWFMQENLYPNCRIYASVNPRSIKKSIWTLKKEILFSEAYDEDGRNKFNQRVLRSSRHILMQPSSAETSLFLFDIDDGIVIGDELPLINALTEVLKIYRTKNGWHVITKPFNPALYKGKAEIKKDPLFLIKY